MPLTKEEKNIRQLESMLGKSYFYEGSQETVLQYEFQESDCIIQTDKQLIRFPWSEANLYFKRFLPITAVVASKDAVEYRPIITNGIVKDMRDTLMDNIQKVKSNPDYLPQARAINNDIKAMIELAKTELLMLRTINKM